MRVKLMVVLFLFEVASVHAQVIADNVFAFGFENVFNWNISILNSQMDDEYVRMICFEDVSTAKDRMILCSLTKLDSSDFKSSISSLKDVIIIDEIKNPHGNSDTVVIQSRDDRNKMFALIDHFGYLLNVSYIDKSGLDKTKFIQFVRTYKNIKIGF